MDHEAVLIRLTDYARGALPGAEARAVEKHLEECAECRGALEAIPLARRAFASAGPALLDPHPDSAELSAFALDPGQLDLGRRGAIAAHVAECPTCGHESALARTAARTSWQRVPWAGTRGAGAGGWFGVLQPALAVLALLLVVPAWLGLVRYPEAVRERDHALMRARELSAQDAGRPSPEATSTPQPPAASPAPQGGAASVLTLVGPRRGAVAEGPTLRLAAGQPYVPVLVAYEPDLSPASRLEVAILHADGSLVWKHTGTWADLWDNGSQVVSLLVPAWVLAPGDFRLEISSAERVEFSAPFRVIGSP